MKNYYKEGEFYHVFNRSIAGFGIFNSISNKDRFIKTLDYYNDLKRTKSLSYRLRRNKNFCPNILIPRHNSIIKYICYCIMPDHYHLLIKNIIEETFSKYISDVENSFTRYFNLKTKRKGPLWQSRFKAVRIKTNNQLLHVSRYIHLNPTTNNLVENPQDWVFSSYKDYVSNDLLLRTSITEISIQDPMRYKKFVEDQIDYQKRLKRIKKMLLD